MPCRGWQRRVELVEQRLGLIVDVWLVERLVVGFVEQFAGEFVLAVVVDVVLVVVVQLQFTLVLRRVVELCQFVVVGELVGMVVLRQLVG